MGLGECGSRIQAGSCTRTYNGKTFDVLREGQWKDDQLNGDKPKH